MKFFLDTNIIIYYMKGQYPAIPEHFKKIPSQSVVIPSVVMAEIEYGARKSRDYLTTINRYHSFTDVFEKVPFTDSAAMIYGEIRHLLEKEGRLIEPNDLLIAATVMAGDGVLVTNNTKEFERVPNLRLENWTI